MSGRRSGTARRTAERRGRIAEGLAMALLMLKGYRLVARRYKTPVGEIDIIAQRGGLLVFVEVKARGTLDVAAESVGSRQRRRIINASRAFLARRPDLAEHACRFDAILVAPGRLPRHVIDAWQAG